MGYMSFTLFLNQDKNFAIIAVAIDRADSGLHLVEEKKISMNGLCGINLFMKRVKTYQP